MQKLCYVGYHPQERENEASLRKPSTKNLKKILRLLMFLGTMPGILQVIKTTGKHLLPNMFYTESNHDHYILKPLQVPKDSSKSCVL